MHRWCQRACERYLPPCRDRGFDPGYGAAHSLLDRPDGSANGLFSRFESTTHSLFSGLNCAAHATCDTLYVADELMQRIALNGAFRSPRRAPLLHHVGQFVCQKVFARRRFRRVLGSSKGYIVPNRERSRVHLTGEPCGFRSRVDSHAAEVLAETRLKVVAHRFRQRSPAASEPLNAALQLRPYLRSLAWHRGDSRVHCLAGAIGVLVGLTATGAGSLNT
jgi:hypothetical protein